MELAQFLRRYQPDKTFLLEILSTYQRSKPTQHLEKAELKTIAEYLSIPESHVASVVAFYSFFSLVPRGRYIIQVCRDVPCYISAKFDVVATLEQMLGIPMGKTTADQLFTLEYTSCLGSCDGAPAIRINETIHKPITEERLQKLIEDCREYRHD
ncbi:MAG: NAD(P)H-dependent oxidoreductase subunit E [Bacilli bacterium]|jgi:NADH-quinone oxidoreductase subunit E